MHKALAAEFLGTFALVFIGAGAVVMDTASGGELGLVGVALAHALVLSVMVTAALPVSGGHLNPAVTFALWIARKISGRGAVFYVLAQLSAALLAAFSVKWLLPAAAGTTTAYGLPRVSAELNFAQAVVLEAIFTIFLVSAVFGTAVSPSAPKVGGFGIGLVLLFDILVGGPLTGAAMNPARAFGPAVAAGDWHAQAIYWVGPLLGAAVAALLWAALLLAKEEE
ncbi:Aquaporin Z 2 [bacterium HR33]|nr:Aquaporin Z 2 [bacterium HR33]